MADHVDYTVALEAREHLRKFWNTHGDVMVDSYRKQGRPGTEWTVEQAIHYLRSMLRVFTNGAVHYVTRDVCDTVVAHANLLPSDEILKRTTFLHSEAFYYFDRPWVVETHPFGPVRYDRIVIIPWGNGVIVDVMGTQINAPHQSVFESTDWGFGYPIEPGWAPDDATRGRNRNVRQTMLALALFERQTLTVATHEQPDRVTRRRWAREHPDQPMPAFRVVRLRRTVPAVEPDHDSMEGDVSHRRRHWVRPFWRNQFYPSENDHHLKLVVGHYRGEGEDVTTEPVYVVER